MKIPIYLCGPPHKTPQPQSNHEKNIRQNPVAGHSIKFLTSMCHNYQKQETCEKLSQSRGMPGDMIIKDTIVELANCILEQQQESLIKSK